eukprot:TRINITY_DN15847_c0_g1_i2.p1 TRINITY_DN15847_c0_g1~~TRINITY_DN15847_c0_g1_i2.p1  ORF type:complete len:112 (-),score=30.56 TRINITY_DN15847_c0_g1_i2:688-1023(-)
MIAVRLQPRTINFAQNLKRDNQSLVENTKRLNEAKQIADRRLKEQEQVIRHYEERVIPSLQQHVQALEQTLSVDRRRSLSTSKDSKKGGLAGEALIKKINVDLDSNRNSVL